MLPEKCPSDLQIGREGRRRPPLMPMPVACKEGEIPMAGSR